MADRGDGTNIHPIPLEVTLLQEARAVLSYRHQGVNALDAAAGGESIQALNGSLSNIDATRAEDSMNTTKPMLSAHINTIKGHQLSEDRRELALVLDAMHVGDLSIVFSADHLDQLATIVAQAKAQIARPGEKNELRVTAPRNWLVTADTKIHDVVVLVFNRQSDSQSAYALAPDAAKKMADALTKNAAAVLKKKTAQSQRREPTNGQKST